MLLSYFPKNPNNKRCVFYENTFDYQPKLESQPASEQIRTEDTRTEIPILLPYPGQDKIPVNLEK